MDMKNFKTVDLNIWVNRLNYKGSVSVNKETHEVDLGELAEVGYASFVSFNNTLLCSIREVLTATALFWAGIKEDVRYCHKSGLFGFKDSLAWVDDYKAYVFKRLCTKFEGRWYFNEDLGLHDFRDASGIKYLYRPYWWWDELCFCEECNCYVVDDDFSDNCCRFCKDKIIESYRVSHNHNNNPLFFGKFSKEKGFSGIGFELEVDTFEDSVNNTETAKGLIAHCGLEDKEVRYAEDGSLDYGFEIISEPHTVKEFWKKQNSWAKMLEYLSREGYYSHDVGTCGLHVHVSRTMFGKGEKAQNLAIGKVYTFFDENWEELVKISRRRNLEYCSRNLCCYNNKGSTLKNWQEHAKNIRGGARHVALNDRNEKTFEYRLGRGTLSPAAFFAWIDLMVVITKNAKRITCKNVETNDIASWLVGLKESSARYIYKRGAFRSTLVAMFPSISWEQNQTENY